VGWQKQMSKQPHSLTYIHQLLAWGFSLEFIAKDAGIDLPSLERRLNRERKRNEHQRQKPKTGSSESDSRRGKEGERQIAS
jgi:hypothetical protein